jgi:hypothetical protein
VVDAILILLITAFITCPLATLSTALISSVCAILTRCPLRFVLDLSTLNIARLGIRLAFLLAWCLARDVADGRRRRIHVLRLQRRHRPEASRPCRAESVAADPCRGEDDAAGAALALTPEVAVSDIEVAPSETERQKSA